VVEVVEEILEEQQDHQLLELMPQLQEVLMPQEQVETLQLAVLELVVMEED
jgi:hypothetical protein